jgi:hypothetical protein
MRGKCQVCGRSVQVLRDGTSRAHKRRSNTRDIWADYCSGSKHRVALWPVGQRLRHHSGDLWEITAANLPGDGKWHNGSLEMPGDYLLRCLAGREQSREMRAHAEYLHRHGWNPVASLPETPPDTAQSEVLPGSSESRVA